MSDDLDQRPEEEAPFDKFVRGVLILIGGTVVLAFLVFGLCFLAMATAR